MRDIDYIVTDKGFYKKLIHIALPVAMQSVIMVGVNLADTIMLGRLGETALSASSLGNQFIMIFIFLCMGISMGSTVLCSRFWGAGEKEDLKKVITIAYRFGLVLAFLFTLINICFAEAIMGLYSNEADVIAAGTTYLRWSTSTYLLMTLSTVTTNIMRSVSITHIPLIASCAAFGVNIGANYVLIFGKLGMPAMGVAGAALGTVIARVVETIIICVYFFCLDRQVNYRIRDVLSRCGDLVKEFIHISVPVMLSDGLLGIGDSALAMIMGHIGSAFVSANAITNVVQRVSTIVISGIAHASCIIIGQTLGERRVEEAKKQGATLLLLGLGFGLLAAGIILLLRTPVISAYRITAETQEIAYQLMNAISLIIVFQAANSILTKGVIRGGGDTAWLVFADTSTMWLLAIPLGALAGLIWKLPAFWVYLCLRADHVAKALWCVHRLHSGKWIKKIKGEL